MASVISKALPFVQTHGFTRSAAVAGTPNMKEWTLSALFPGPDSSETSLPRRLFAAWDQEHLPARAAGYDAAVEHLEQRLAHSWQVRHHLVKALALESTLPVVGAHAVPTPLPALERAMRIADAALPPSSDGEWYATRLRLAGAYTAAELHLSSSRSPSLSSSADVLHRLAHASPSTLPDLGAWARWGWLGIFRSLSL